jgi:hypothetical protein
MSTKYNAIDGNGVRKCDDDLKNLVWAFHSGAWLRVYENGKLIFDGTAESFRRKLRAKA